MSFRKAVFRKITHVIFDLDGLLLDTEKMYQEVIKQVVEIYNKKYSFEEHLKVMGTTEKRTAEIVIKDLELPTTVPEFLKYYDQKAIDMMGDAQLMKGADRLVRHLYAHKIPFAMATGSSMKLLEVKIKNHKEFFDLFDHTVSSYDSAVKRGKPAPDIFLVTASRFSDKPKPNKCLVFEDAPNGVEGAIAAGMQCVMVPNENCPMDQRKLANIVLKSLEDIQLELFGLPPFK